MPPPTPHAQPHFHQRKVPTNTIVYGYNRDGLLQSLRFYIAKGLARVEPVTAFGKIPKRLRKEGGGTQERLAQERS